MSEIIDRRSFLKLAGLALSYTALAKTIPSAASEIVKDIDLSSHIINDRWRVWFNATEFMGSKVGRWEVEDLQFDRNRGIGAFYRMDSISGPVLEFPKDVDKVQESYAKIIKTLSKQETYVNQLISEGVFRKDELSRILMLGA